MPQVLLTYTEAIERAFARIAQNRVPSSWFDALASGRLSPQLWRSIHVPEHGVLRDQRKQPLRRGRDAAIDAIWALGGSDRLAFDELGLEIARCARSTFGEELVQPRGRRNPHVLQPGDAVDFWKVLLADRAAGRLILYAEMKLPGEAWLEFQVSEHGLVQTATFRPRGLYGRAY